MTQSAIIGKLRTALSDEVDSECKVLYVLAESRKLLETYPPDPVPVALKIYCHWALHVKLSKPGTTLPFLKQVDVYVARVLGGKEDLVRSYRMLEEFVFLKTLREQFKEFLQSFNLPSAVCDDDSRWNRFLESYAGIIEDGSLSCQAKGHKFKFIREVIFKKGKPASNESYLPFRLLWNIILLDGRTMTVEIQAGQYGGPSEGISNVISLV